MSTKRPTPPKNLTECPASEQERLAAIDKLINEKIMEERKRQFTEDLAWWDWKNGGR